MRLFVATYPPAAACDDVERQLARLNVAIAAGRGVNTRLARRETWHVTLAFLGEVKEDRLPDVDAAVGRAVNGLPAPQVCLAGGGRFGRGRFTLLWVGMEGEELAGLARQVRRELKRARLPYDDKPFKPHLTVARPGDRVERALVDADRAALAGYRGPAWRAETVELIRSHLGPKPSYDHLSTWQLS
ncbi:MAG TPA: RNA 2',3'-cyclic phosphodiesterase [Actinoplanes sp.]|jgi:2'-5' RNA ligase